MIKEAFTIALASALTPDEESQYRWLCRQYSKRFNTPLPTVESMPTYSVALAVYEDMLEVQDEDELLERAYKWVEPEQSEDELDRFIKKALEEEEARVQKKAQKQSLKKHSESPSKPLKVVNRRYEALDEELPPNELGDLDGLEDLE